jgi:hypothetical protein
MNFEQAKALRLQQWRSTLDDHSDCKTPKRTGSTFTP